MFLFHPIHFLNVLVKSTNRPPSVWWKVVKILKIVPLIHCIILVTYIPNYFLLLFWSLCEETLQMLDKVVMAMKLCGLFFINEF